MLLIVAVYLTDDTAQAAGKLKYPVQYIMTFPPPLSFHLPEQYHLFNYGG